MGWGPIIPFESYGEHYRKLRRMMHQHFNPQATRSYQAMHLQQVDKLLFRLLENPREFYGHFQKYALDRIFSLSKVYYRLIP